MRQIERDLRKFSFQVGLLLLSLLGLTACERANSNFGVNKVSSPAGRSFPGGHSCLVGEKLGFEVCVPSDTDGIWRKTTGGGDTMEQKWQLSSRTDIWVLASGR